MIQKWHLQDLVREQIPNKGTRDKSLNKKIELFKTHPAEVKFSNKDKKSQCCWILKNIKNKMEFINFLNRFPKKTENWAKDQTRILENSWWKMDLE